MSQSLHRKVKINTRDSSQEGLKDFVVESPEGYDPNFGTFFFY